MVPEDQKCTERRIHTSRMVARAREIESRSNDLQGDLDAVTAQAIQG